MPTSLVYDTDKWFWFVGIMPTVVIRNAEYISVGIMPIIIINNAVNNAPLSPIPPMQGKKEGAYKYLSVGIIPTKAKAI